MKTSPPALRDLARNTPSLAVAAKVLPLGIFAHHLGIILMKFELIRYVVKEERLYGTTLNNDGLHFAPTALRITWSRRPMSNLTVREEVGGLVATRNESVKNAKIRIWRNSKKLKLANTEEGKSSFRKPC